MAAVIDKTGALARLEGAKVDLGCGPRKRSSDYLGVDALYYEGVDIVGDVFDVLAHVPDQVLSKVFSSHFFEHVDDLEHLMVELGRVIKQSGTLETVVPHFSNPYYWSDSTHKRPFGLYSMAYFSAATPFKRGVPTYQRELQFVLESVSLHFKSPPPFYVRYAAKRAIEYVVNLTTASMEFYEENLCYLLPCYEVRYVMRRIGT
jgi:SAM-dependent methyltransferase